MPARRRLWENLTFWGTVRYDGHPIPDERRDPIPFVQVLPGDPDLDRLDAAVKAVFKAVARGDWYFKQFLMVPEAAELRAALYLLEEAYRGEDNDDDA